MKSLFS